MSEELVFNGIDGSTGGYFTPGLTPADISRIAQGVPLDPEHLKDLKARQFRDEKDFGVIEGVDPKDLASAGWGALFAHNVDPGVRHALKELLDHRQALAGKIHAHYYKEYTGANGYRVGDPNESKREFLKRNGAAAGMPADPDRVPYYLLIVADPAAVPYRFQYQLDVEYAVGRLWFENEKDGTPDLDAFARYARSVVAAESGAVALPRRATFLGAWNDGDSATRLSANDLVGPLAEALAATRADWTFETLLKDKATKADLTRRLGGAETPALLFTAGHGMGFPNGDPRQLPHQGGLLCQDWPGPDAWRQAIPHDFYVAADDVGADARVLGMLAFHFACYGAGTPALDDFAHLKQLPRRGAIAPKPFIARLPQRLLSHPNGGALAVIGHVERAWGCSFHGGPRLGRQLQVFQGALTRLLDGSPVGWALEYFNQRYASLSSDLSEELENIKYCKIPDDLLLTELWTSNNDARSYVVLGDPAVRLPAAPAGTPPRQRPSIEVPTVSTRTPSHEKSPMPAPVDPPPAGPAPPGVSISLGAARSSADAEGGVTIVVPLEITIRLGAVSVSAPLGMAESLSATSPSPAPAPALPLPPVAVEGTDLRYYLLAYDESSRERTDVASGLVSEAILAALNQEPITDIMLFCHGWMGDVPGARVQYQNWLRAMADQTADRDRARSLRPNFRPLLIGLHWPSKPWGDERLGAESFSITDPVEARVGSYTRWLGDTPEIRTHLRTIFSAARAPGASSTLPPEVAAAYIALEHAIGLKNQGVAGAPGSDRGSFDPEAVFQAARHQDGPKAAEPESFDLSSIGDALLAPLRTLSFWTMKDRARVFGESAIHPFLIRLQGETAGRDVRFHLMGHSFGCIVASAAVAGAAGAAPLPRPVDSLSLLQGALSLWSYCGDIPYAPGQPGYFHRLLAEKQVRGPILTTQSRSDRAVGTWYPQAARVAGDLESTPEFPEYGALGAFGIQGADLGQANLTMLKADAPYSFSGGKVYNLEASDYIKNILDMFAGAHNDIGHPEVAHAIWSAISPVS